jgi:hypothetical protein
VPDGLEDGVNPPVFNRMIEPGVTRYAAHKLSG